MSELGREVVFGVVGGGSESRMNRSFGVSSTTVPCTSVLSIDDRLAALTYPAKQKGI